jgi:hypothetical protein
MHRYTQGNFAARATNWIDDYIRSLGSRSALAIDHNSALLWCVRDKASVAPPASR